RRRHTRFHVTGVQTCALPILDAQVGPLDSHGAYVDYLKGMRGFLAAAAAMLDPEPALPPLLRALDRDLESAGVHGGPTGPGGPEIGRASCRERGPLQGRCG